MVARHSTRAGLVLFLAFNLGASVQGELRVPAFTAYLEPDPEGAEISEEAGITGWQDPALKVLWFGELKTTGKLDCSVSLRAPVGQVSKFRLNVAGQTREARVTGESTQLVTANFGSFPINTAGYERFTLESLNPAGQPCGIIEALLLDGPATNQAHFNLEPRRNAASVHLRYAVPADVKVSAFYCEVTSVEEPVHTFYMACGWHRGYFGMQINGPRERRIIFSVWDAHSGADDRKRVASEDQVSLVAAGEGVVTGEFGHEGSGGHSHYIYPWKTGEPQRFIVTAQPTNGESTIYSGYYFLPDHKQWKLISSWRAPRDGGWLRGLHSFSEDFDGGNGHLRRKARYGNQWICTDVGQWLELTSASFSCDATGRTNRLDRCMGVEVGSFFLAQGGFLPGFTDYGAKFSRPPGGNLPQDFTFPKP